MDYSQKLLEQKILKILENTVHTVNFSFCYTYVSSMKVVQVRLLWGTVHPEAFMTCQELRRKRYRVGCLM